MNYSASLPTILVFAAFVGAVLGLSFYLGGKAKSARATSPPHGRSTGSSTASPSPATTCRPRRSSASAA